MTIGIGIDVYGTLVDPLEMNVYLRPLVGAAAEKLAELWRTKQLEYTFRRASMGTYENFDVCSRQALVFASESLQIGLSTEDRERLIEQYQSLQPYPDVVSGLQKLKEAGYQTLAFSNGVEATVRSLLQRAEILPYLRGIVSVDDLKTFKPDPRVYFYLAQRLGCPVNHTWLVSSNPFDVIGAKSAGLRAAWIIYMLSYFLGGSLGAALGAFGWQHRGWSGVCTAGVAMLLVALAAHISGTRELRAVSTVPAK